MTIPLTRLVNGTSDASGNLTVRFPDSPPIGQTWTGTISVPGAPSGAFFQASVAGTPWATGVGPGAFGPVQALANLPLTVTAIGLVPLTLYTFYWQGTADNASEAPVVWPDLPALPAAYNGPVLLDRFDTIAPTGTLTYPTLTCGPWQAIAVNCQTAFPCQLLLQWYGEANLVTLMGSKVVVIDDGLTANFTVPNQGPFLSIQASANTSGADVTMIAGMTNRTAVPWCPADMLPIIDVQGVTIPAGATQVFKADYTYSGPAFAALARDAASYNVVLEGLELFGNSHLLIDWDTSTGTPSMNEFQELIVPPLRLQVSIHNESAGPGTFFFSLVGDLFH